MNRSILLPIMTFLLFAIFLMFLSTLADKSLVADSQINSSLASARQLP
jgi:hypothetical protein